MSRIRQRIDDEIFFSSDNSETKKRKEPSMPPRSKEEAKKILDLLWERNPVLSLTCHMSALTGLRYSDASWLKYSDFYDEFGNFKESFRICQQKTYRMRRGGKKPMSKEEAFRKSLLTVYTTNEIRDIVEEARCFSGDSEYLFMNRRSQKTINGKVIHRPMNVESADLHHKIVKGLIEFPYTLGTHSWRKFFANELLQQGASIEKIRDLLGHSSLVSTNAYLHSFSDELKKAVTSISLG